MNRMLAFGLVVALAVAVGVALAPYVLWLVPVALLALPVVWLQRRVGWKGVGALAAGAVMCALFAVWAIWLYRRGQHGDAWFVVTIFVVWLASAFFAEYRKRVTAARQPSEHPSN